MLQQIPSLMVLTLRKVLLIIDLALWIAIGIQLMDMAWGQEAVEGRHLERSGSISAGL